MQKKLIVAAALALFMAGCGPAQKLADFGKAVTQTIVNPVDQVDIYRVKNLYAATLELFVQYRTYCWARPYAALMADPIAKPICENRRAVVRTVQRERPKVAAAIKTAENFVRDNPTLNATSAIGAAWRAVNDFKALVPVVR